MSAARQAPVIGVRDAEQADMAALQAIYGQHVGDGLGTFEEVASDVAEMTRRRAAAAAGLPYLVGEVDGTVGGFAYAAQFRPRPAYRHAVEDSIYVAADAAGRGLGRRLLQELIALCTELGYRQMVAVIGDSANMPSINLHADLGFRHVGVLTPVGFKGGRWVDTVTMQLPLGDGGGTLPAA